MKSSYSFNPIVAMACMLALIFTLVAPAPASAGLFKSKSKAEKPTVSLGWDNVLKLKKGDRVIITLFSKKLYQGQVEKVDPEGIGISLQKKQGSLLIARDEIRIVELDKKHNAIVTGLALEVAGAGVTIGGELLGDSSYTNCFNNAEMNNQSAVCTSKSAVTYVGVGIVGAGSIVQIFGRAPRFLYQVDAPPATQAPAQ
jgi:hypothetical protein